MSSNHFTPVFGIEVYKGLNYTTREINQNFKIKLNGINQYGKKVNTLIGVCGLIHLVGIQKANKMIKKAFSSKEDKTECKVYGRARVTFYTH